MPAKADLTARTFRSALVGWCQSCNFWTEPYEKGGECPDWCYTDSLTPRKQVKRRMWICDSCGEAWLSKQGAIEHDCDHWLD